jgi:hypothetical protein
MQSLSNSHTRNFQFTLKPGIDLAQCRLLNRGNAGLVYRRLFILLWHEDEPSGINRIYRLYRRERLAGREGLAMCKRR